MGSLYDKKGNDVLDEWLINYGKKQSSNVWMQSLSNKMDKILQKLENIEMRMNEKNRNGIKAWLKRIGLMQYFDVFIENGFDTMSTLILLQQTDLNGMGINKIGHRLKL